MGEVIYSDFSYYYEGEGISEKLFDYRESIKDYTMIPMHSFDNSIDAVLKRIHGALVEHFGQTDPNLISVFFMSYILLVNRHMEEPEPMRVLAIGEHLDWISEYIKSDVKMMNPGSNIDYVRNSRAVGGSDYDIIICFDNAGADRSLFFEKEKALLFENCRIIYISRVDNEPCEGWSRYLFGEYEIITRQVKQKDISNDDIVNAFPIEEKEKHYRKKTGEPKRVIKTVAAITPHDTPFTNYELIKDIGAVPYLFFRNKNCKVYMVGIDKEGDYSFARYVQGEELVELDNYSIDSKLSWLKEHGKDVDCLMLFGTYENNMVVAKAYKNLNSDGVIYLGLDASAFWINNIPRYEKKVDEFYKNCDVIGTSTIPLCNFISKKWKIDISVVRCGYYPFGIKRLEKPGFAKKKNVILTVGRIGTRQKRNDIMMQAFALASKEIDDWELRIVGPVENEFFEFIDSFTEEYPFLEDVIVFTGGIEDKEKLHQEFMDAKIFLLTSEFEGFPNVIPEAMSAGNAIITTDIDNSDEIIDYGNCGIKAPINNVTEIAENIRRLCNDEVLLRRFCENSYRNYLERFDYNLIIDELYDELIRV